MTDSMEALDTPMEGMLTGAMRVDESCSGIVAWADDARALPKPDDEPLADAWEHFIDAGAALGGDACSSGDEEAISEANSDVQDAINGMQEAILAL
jgi:hypothetical protein